MHLDVNLTEEHCIDGIDGIDGIVEIIYLRLKICGPTSNLLAHCCPYATVSLARFVSIKKKKKKFNAVYGNSRCLLFTLKHKYNVWETCSFFNAVRRVKRCFLMGQT